MYFATDSSIVCGQTVQFENDLTSVAGDDVVMTTAGSGDDINSNTNNHVSGGGSNFEIIEIDGKRWIATLSEIGQIPNENCVEYSTFFKDLCLCVPCNVFYESEEARMIHVQSSENHPRCERCDERFEDNVCLQNHRNTSIRHNICPECEFDFYTPEDLNSHIYPSQTDTSVLLNEVIDDFRTYSDLNGTESEEEPPGAYIAPYWNYSSFITPDAPALDVPTIQVIPPTPLSEKDYRKLFESWPKLDHRYLQPPIPKPKRKKRKHTSKSKLRYPNNSNHDHVADGSITLAGKMTIDGVEYIIATDGIGNSCLVDQARLLAEYRKRIEAMEREGLQYPVKQA